MWSRLCREWRVAELLFRLYFPLVLLDKWLEMWAVELDSDNPLAIFHSSCLSHFLLSA